MQYIPWITCKLQQGKYEVQLRNARGKNPSPQLESKPMATTFQILVPSVFLVGLNIYFITIGWLVNIKANDMFLSSLRKNDIEA